MANLNYCVKDTINIIQQQDYIKLINEYQEILEKTNSQLSLWNNPYGILIGILGVFVAVLAVIVAFVLFRQSRSNRQMVRDAVGKYEEKLERLVEQNQISGKMYEDRLNNLINEYKLKLETSDDNEKNKYQDFISKLYDQIQLLDTTLKFFKHSGNNYRDIQVNYHINQNSLFYAKISLNEINQSFYIYIRILTADNKKYWLGFAGGLENKVYKTKNEFTQYKIYNTKDILISENIQDAFIKGFKENVSQPILVEQVRLRASDLNKNDIYYEFKVLSEGF